MSLLEGWFKKPEEKEALQNAVNDAVEKSKVAHLLEEDKEKASKGVEDQEFNNAAQALFNGNNLDEVAVKPGEAEKVLNKINVDGEGNKEFNSNYITKN